MAAGSLLLSHGSLKVPQEYALHVYTGIEASLLAGRMQDEHPFPRASDLPVLAI